MESPVDNWKHELWGLGLPSLGAANRTLGELWFCLFLTVLSVGSNGGSALRTFFENATRVSEGARMYTVLNEVDQPAPSHSHLFLAEVVVYDSLGTPPKMTVLQSSSAGSLIEELSSGTHRLVCEMGGSFPYAVIREIMENLIHADFRNVVVSILESGRVLRVADQGPGISNKAHALLPGFTTASSDMKAVIRGVGSGLPLVSDYLTRSGGNFSIEDNLGTGTVLTLEAALPSGTPTNSADGVLTPQVTEIQNHDNNLTPRQKKVLALAFEYGEVGPTLLSKELSVGLSTAFRDLEHLTMVGLIEQNDVGRRTLTRAGVNCVNQLFSE
ncbi:MAG: ATP-binding protein [Actinobacteria bacterium]|nr:ATP-binding protein [Actinomycetota bacterium]MCL5887970.1 ATP-binding protein [Actinomycetota bacterium]